MKTTGLLLCIWLPFQLLGNACVLDQWQVSLDVAYEKWDTDEFWNKSGKKRSAANDFEKKEAKALLEFGLTRCDTLSVRSSWARFDESINGRTFGFTDLEIGWKRTLYQKDHHLISGQIVILIPFESDYEPPLRYGRNGAEFNLLYSSGFTFCDHFGYYDGCLGYRWYKGFPSDQIRANFALGYFVCPWLKLVAESKLEYGIFNGDDRPDASLIYLNPNYRLLRIDVLAELCPCSFSSAYVGYFRHVWGRNVGTGGGFVGGANVWY